MSNHFLNSITTNFSKSIFPLQLALHCRCKIPRNVSPLFPKIVANHILIPKLCRKPSAPNFIYLPPKSVAPSGKFYVLFAHHYPKFPPPKSVARNPKHKTLRANFLSFAENEVKTSSRKSPLFFEHFKTFFASKSKKIPANLQKYFQKFLAPAFLFARNRK